ncbi:putative peroxisomal half ABC transporter [Tilletiaria anomala UBC 951]|uniref:Putative peroxisomal half ABC transporter n=1 Tax=Tilletiaria anomala (strain ATCC 24038 / CBS 436.72 / UBC 951) TaxID=1037660 RepID=A0A066VCR6_TILAU|nr:putative peroxisomal half ABC transporter [Tilletiaria anomala UBC 951]KDN38098.1 putative peroxisomal half ABC transporter [Tilletiaria anomala UBC 951]
MATSGAQPILASLQRKRSRILPALLLLLLLQRKRIAAALLSASVGNAAGRPARPLSAALKLAHATDDEIQAALEQLYIPNPDGSRTLLVPHRGRVSKVPIKPTQSETFRQHYHEFSKLPILPSASTTTNKGKEVQKGDAAAASDEKGQRALQEAKVIRDQGGAAAASAKKVGVNKEFFRQLQAIFRIIIPRWHCKESYIFLLHTSFLVLRTYLSLLVARLDGAIVGDLVSANGKGFLRGLGLWFALAVPSTYTNSMIRYLQSKLSIGFRTRLTRYVHDLYMSDSRNYYKIINLDGRLDSADQFITSDVARFCDTLASLYSNVSKPTLDLLIFNYQLGKALGGPGIVALFGNYLLTGWLLRKISPAFGKLAAIEAKLEGDFRAAHSRIITNAEEIAFYDGASTEFGILERAYMRLIRHVNSILKIRVTYSMCEDMILKYAWSAAGYVIIASPFLFGKKKPSQDEVAAAKVDVDQTGSRKQKSQVAKQTESYISNRRLLLSLADAGSRLMYSYKELAELAGYTSRVYTLLSTLHLLDRNKFQALPRPMDMPASQTFYDLGNIQGNVREGVDQVSFDRVPIVAPAPGMERGGEELVRNLSLHIKPGEHILITGPNGVGKTAIARVIAGLWPVFAGELAKPSDKDIFFLPQRPYLSTGSLRDQVIYPYSNPEHVATGRTDAELQQLLADVHLAYLPDREGGWETRKEWKDVLSGGEKQRMGMARLLYHHPKFGILDECTSAVSTDVEGLMYTRAKDMGITLITISHRPSLFKYHSLLLRLSGEDGEWDLSQIGGEEELMSFAEEIADLESKLKEVDSWKKRVSEIQSELSFSTQT